MEYEQIKKLIDNMGESKIDELQIDFPDGTKISMSKNTNTINGNSSITSNNTIKNEETIKFEDNFKTITSPMVGTFYLKPSPDKEPFVKIGDMVKKGDTLCIIEAMKLMNEIESEYDGEIKEILISDGEMVDFAKPLFKII